MATREEVLSLSSGLRTFQSGSRVICNPPVLGTDEDWVVLVASDPTAVMLAAGFSQDGSPEFYTGNDNGGFSSWRRGDINIITTQSEDFFSLFETATELAKRFNLRIKSDRIALFQAVLYNVRWPNLAQENYKVMFSEQVPA